MAVPQHTNEHDQEHAHPSIMVYVQIAIVLAIITSAEVAVYYIDAMEPYLVYTLLAMSAVKFLIVVGYFMHLKFDNRLFSAFFFFGLTLGITLVASFMALFDRY
jgi:cytochrome c oxidase subunit 4